MYIYIYIYIYIFLTKPGPPPPALCHPPLPPLPSRRPPLPSSPRINVISNHRHPKGNPTKQAEIASRSSGFDATIKWSHD